MSSLASATISYLIYLFVSIRFGYESITANWIQGNAAVYTLPDYHIFLWWVYVFSIMSRRIEQQAARTRHWLLHYHLLSGYIPLKCVYGLNGTKKIEQSNSKSGESPLATAAIRQNWTSILFFSTERCWTWSVDGPGLADRVEHASHPHHYDFITIY